MAKEEKSVIEQALLEAQQIDATFKANAKEILTQTMGSEIEEMVKESLKGSGTAINEEEDDDMDLATDLDMGGDLDLGIEDNETDDLDLDLGDEGLEGLEDEMDVVDLTGADDSELITVFKKMGADDEIEVVQDEDGLSFKDLETGAEYKVELGGGEMEDELEDLESEEGEEIELSDDDLDSMDLEDENELEDEESEEVVYEIEITEEDEEEEEEEDELEEGSRTLGSGKSHGRRGLPKPKAYKKEVATESRRISSIDKKLVNENKVLRNKLKGLDTENQELKENQEKMVDALKQFRQKLQEVAVFNSNLAHVVRLFTENTTTKEEKVEIVKRMDEAKTLKESKLIFKTLSKELEGGKTKKTIQESVDEKVNKTASTGASQIITESKVFVHPELEKMKKMWEFNYKYK